MARLILWRHAKSDWSVPVPTDHDRPLSARGRSAAPRMAAEIANRALLPDAILCSSARRTLETLSTLVPYLEPCEITITRAVYMADAGGLLDLVRGLGTRAQSLMVIGHNPTLEDAAAVLSRPDGDAYRRAREKFPTAALAVIDFGAAALSAAHPQSGTLETFLVPRDLSADRSDP